MRYAVLESVYCREVHLNDEAPDILVVDDDPILCSILIDSIAIYLPQAKVSRAYSTKEALSALDYKHYDLLVTDNIMPGMNGIDIIDEIKEKYPDLKIIMMTAFNPVSLQQKLDEFGDIPLLSKPFGLADLVETLEPHW